MIVVTACFPRETKEIPPRPDVRIVHTAMGARAADGLAQSVIERPTLLLSTGFAGGLAPELRLGDLVIAEEVRSNGETVRVDRAFVEKAERVLARAGMTARVGSVECSAEVAGRAEKRELGAQGAVSVDMESGPLARWARERSIPFLSCRVVLDAATEDVVFSGRVPFWMSALRHPVHASRMMRACGVAACRLGTAIDALLDAWEVAT